MTLYPPQADIIEAGLLDSGFSCLLQMATGSGKTWLAQQAIEAVLRRGQRAIYLAPLRALASELAEAWKERFADYRIGIFTGDYGSSSRAYPVPFQEAQLLVMTPERLDFCTRRWRSHWNWIPLVDLVVVDEFHLLGDGRRGARLEGALSRFQRLNPFARLLCLSATIGNRDQLANWLEAVTYESKWRPVPLDWRIVRFRKADEKPEILREVVADCTQKGGKSLVFVQSRRRAEQLSEALQASGLNAVHHHAGLDQPSRKRVEEGFRARAYDVLVATSTLEMGLNLPVRQVVLYDLQQFDGTGFSPLAVNNVWQRVGRAGRPGSDVSGEAVLLAPAWDRDAQGYSSGEFEPILSRLCDERALGEQIVVEVAGRYARTRTQVERLLACSLAAHQGLLPEKKVRSTLATLVDSGMLVEGRDGENETSPLRLRVTRVGRVAVRHMLYPATVLQFLRTCSAQDLTFLDLLLVVSSVSDCEPVLPVDFEELGALEYQLSAEPSRLLTRGASIEEQLGVNGRRLLSSIKMALAIRALTRGHDPDKVATVFGCYPFELERLSESVERLLLALHALVTVNNDADGSGTTSGWEADQVTVAERAEMLQRMVAARLDETAITLTRVKGIGSKLAGRLVEHGVCHIEALSQATSAEVAIVPGISLERAEGFIGDAKLVSTLRPAQSYQETGSGISFRSFPKTTLVDPYRMRRARDLKVTAIEHGRFRVTGGSDPHQVEQIDGGHQCDCGDFRKGHRNCKHVLAVRLSRGDQELTQYVSAQTNRSTASDALDLMQLWTGSAVGDTLQKVEGWR